MDQVTSTTPKSWFSCKAFHTAAEPSTILFPHGGCPAYSASHPLRESHSSTTLAAILFPLLAVILIIFPHLFFLSNHPVDSATTRSMLLWNHSSHSDPPPPSPPSLKSLNVSLAFMDDVTGGEHVYLGYDFPLQQKVPEDLPLSSGDEPPPPRHVWVPTSGSSLPLPLMCMS
ncbi:hypothetical protein Pyn_12356 [Prunus yedoensis var. nudiflora]|uniref:Uncharacterized protein n=1 Tax=Prunus yedoensis var. nudiflora TaxID=2094558 RepID=A0A314YLD2_PRUYE|nr:hypothetical protein Pyn_12356 [Prunus yedoensis var. nudiflora]